MLTDLQKRKLTKFFCMYDANHDGELVCQDFDNLVKKMAALRNWGSRYPKYLALQSKFMQTWKLLKGEADTDRDQKVSLLEWLNYYDTVLGDPKKYDQEVRSLMELVFEVFDYDDDGKISQQEWGDFFKVYNISCVYAPSVFLKLDSNQDGFLSRDEALQLIHSFFYENDPEAPANSMFGPY